MMNSVKERVRGHNGGHETCDIGLEQIQTELLFFFSFPMGVQTAMKLSGCFLENNDVTLVTYNINPPTIAALIAASSYRGHL